MTSDHDTESADTCVLPGGWVARLRDDLELGAIDLEGPGCPRICLTKGMPQLHASVLHALLADIIRGVERPMKAPALADQNGNTLGRWVDGPPPVRDDGALAIVELHAGVEVDGQPHNSQSIIVSRWSGKLKTTAGAHRLDYEAVRRHIEIAEGAED